MPRHHRRRATWRRRLGAVLLALAVTGLAACAGEAVVAPLPIEPAQTTTPATTGPAVPASPAATAGPSSRPPRTRPRTPAPPPSPEPTRESSCYGPIRYDLKIAETEFGLLKSLCFAAGARLRLQGIGPGLVTVDPESLVSQSYEAGVVDILFLRPGTVEVTIPHDDRTDTITVVVIR